MNDLEALLKEYDEPAKGKKKEPAQFQVAPKKPFKPTSDFSYDTAQPTHKVPVPALSKYDSNPIDTRKGNIPQYSQAEPKSEARQTSNYKQPPKPSFEQSFDIDAILQGRNIQPQPSKFLQPIGPSKNNVSSPRRDSLSDWLSDDASANIKAPPAKVTSTKANLFGRPTLDANPDDFFANASNSRDHSASKAPFSMNKPSAKQYYLGSSRYKPGRTVLEPSMQLLIIIV